MPNVFPQSQVAKSGGILFVNEPGVANFRALRVDVGDQHLYWQPTYQNLLRVEGAFGEFFPQAEFSDNGNRIVFTKYIEGVEVLGKTRALRPGECIPRREWLRFLTTWQSFKRLSERTDIPDDFRNFIIKFGPPSVERYPAAYRIYRPHWYSRPRLFILWGLEPVGGADFISLSPEQAISEVGARVETDRDESNGRLFLWLKAFGLFVLTCLLLLLVVWTCLPRPVVDFELTAQAMQSTQPINKTGFDQDWVWGQTAYQWTFDQGQPANSNDFQPDVLWAQSGLHDATLQVTQSTLWGFLYKTEAKSKSVLVKEAPKPPPVIVVTPRVTVGHPDDKPSTPNGFGTVDKPREDGIHTPGSIDGPGLTIIVPDDKNPGGPGRTGNPSDGLTVITPGNPSGPKMDSEGKPLPGGSDLKPAPEGSMKPGESKLGPDGKAMPLDPTEPSKDTPGLEALPGGEGKPGPMKGDTTSPGRIDGQLEVTPAKPAGPDGKPMPTDPSKDGASNEKMTPQEPKPVEPTPGKGELTPGEKGTNSESPRPLAPRKLPKRVDALPRVLSEPGLEVINSAVVNGTDSQDIEFSVQMATGTKVERVTIDGKTVEVSRFGFFKKRLSLGEHEIHVEYGSTDSDVHEAITSTLTVDADKVVTPKNKLGPAKKLPSKSTNTPADSEPQTKPETPEKIDKKLA